MAVAAESRLRVHWMAPFFSGGGYCSEAIAFVRALEEHGGGRAISIDQHGDSISSSFLQQLPPSTSASLQRMYRTYADPTASVCVCHSEPGAWRPARYPTTECPPRGARYTVGRTMFETDRLPDGWADRLNRMDEVWVPTEFSRGVFKAGGVDAFRLRVVGEPVDTDEFDPERVKPLPTSLMEGPRGEGGPWETALAGSASRLTRFLSVFKWEYRKGWDVLLKAYLGGFTSEDPVVLYLLTSAYHSTSDFAGEMLRFQKANLACANTDEAPDGLLVMHGGGDGRHASSVDEALPRPSGFCIDFEGTGLPPARDGPGGAATEAARLRSRIRRLQPSSLPRYRVLRRLGQEELPSAYRSADALVLPSRGEGWGRPHVEAMAMGLPVVATNWSGPTAFLNEANGWPVPWTHLRPIPEGPFAGHRMAEPDEEALRAAMRQIHLDPDEAARRGRRARADMLASFSPQALAADVNAHLARIDAALGPVPPRHEDASNLATAPMVSSEADEAAARAYDAARAQDL